MSFAIQAYSDKMQARAAKKVPIKGPTTGIDATANGAIQKALESQKVLVDGIPRRNWGDVELRPIKS